jgi:hypothetical protein
VNKKIFLSVFVLLTLLVSGFFQPGYSSHKIGVAAQNSLQPMVSIDVCNTCLYTSIQAAIDAANPNDTIQLADEIYEESITVDKNIAIIGVGPQGSIIQAAENLSASTSRVITVTNGVTAQLEGVTIQFGSADGDGGGILNQGNLTIDNTLITNNQTNSGGGGGIANLSGYITLTNSTVSNNASAQPGGGIANNASQGDATIEITNSTISDNNTENGGGGIYNQESTGSANLIIQQVTLFSNDATPGSNLYIHSGSVAIAQSILADSSISGDDCSNLAGTITDNHFNLVEDGSCGFPVGGDPKLLFLTDNGGNTPTNALQSTSPALDQVPAQECASLSDQRGETRPFGAGCDIGAFELHEQSLNFSLETSSASTFIGPGELITFTITVEPIGPGISNGTIAGDMSEEFAILGSLALNPPDSGIVGSGPPILAHSMIISATKVATLTMQTQVDLGLEAGIELFNQVSFTSSEVITPLVTTATFTIKNVPPIAVDDSGSAFTTSPDKPFTTGNVLDNDYDPNGDSITYLFSNSGDLKGNILDYHDGTFYYDPGYAFEDLPSGATAYDQFSYSIWDQVSGIVQGTVTIIIYNSQFFTYLPLVTK